MVSCSGTVRILIFYCSYTFYENYLLIILLSRVGVTVLSQPNEAPRGKHLCRPVLRPQESNYTVGSQFVLDLKLLNQSNSVVKALASGVYLGILTVYILSRDNLGFF